MTEQNTTQNTPVFRMQKMYIKDFSFENPNAPQVFIAGKHEPKVDLNLQVNSKKVDDDHWEVSLAVTVKMMNTGAEDQIMFVVEIEHAGIFLMKNIPQEHIQRVLAIDCPLMLFPFTRQIISQASVDGGFMPFLMDPINFIALYDSAQQQQNGPKQ